jgi:hypothetical protein
VSGVPKYGKARHTLGTKLRRSHVHPGYAMKALPVNVMPKTRLG